MLRLICLLTLLSVSALAAPRAQTTSGAVTYIVRPGAVIAQKGGQEMWRKTDVFRRAESLQMLVSGKVLLILSSEGRHAYLTAFSSGTGARLWQEGLIDEDSTNLKLRGTSHGMALITAVWGPPKVPRVVVVSLAGGEVMYKKPGELLGFQGQYAALLDYGLNLEVPADAWLPLVRLDLERAKRTYMGLTIPERPGCGKVYSRNKGKPDLQYDHQYITALRRDKCGNFTVKVAWQGRPGQDPLIQPPARR